MPRPLRRRQETRVLDPTVVKKRLAYEPEAEDDIVAKLPKPLAPDEDEFGAELEELARVSGLEATFKARREQLRDQITPRLTDAYAFIGADGAGYYAYTQTQSNTEVDLELLKKMIEPEVFEEVTETKINLTAFRRAAAADRIPDEAVVATVRFKDKKPFVKFGVIPEAD